MRRLLIPTVVALAAALPAAAQNLVASDPDGLVAFFVDQGMPARLETDGVGDPMIEVRYYGTEFQIYFYGCTEGADCRSIQFFSGYKTEPPLAAETINQWNADQRYVRAYLSESGSSRIEYDVYLGEGGLTPADFNDVVSGWTRGLTQFEEFIGW